MNFDQEIDALRSTTGGVYELPPGISDLTVPITLSYTDAASDVHADPRHVTIRGQSMGTTVLKNMTAAPAISVIGDNESGNGWGAITYAGVEDLTITGNGSGLKLKEIAFGNYRNLMFRSMPLALDLESVLSTSFERIYMTGGVDGIRAYKGAGFSDHNANKYISCEFRLGTGVAFKSGPASGLWFDDLTVQGWGTHGNPNSGGLDLEFTGAEGGVGLEISGAYFEVNAGGFDIRLNNMGAETITHVITAANFNRISASKHVWANIAMTGGPQKLVLIGCHFNGLNDYVPSADRPIVHYNPSLHEVIAIGCHLGDPIERNGVGGAGLNSEFTFRVSAAGVVTGQPGWTTQQLSPGVVRVIHNLNILGGAYGFQATITDANSGFILHTLPADNYVDVVTGMDFVSPANRGFSGSIKLI